MAMPASCAARAMTCDSAGEGRPGSARKTPSEPSTLPPAALMGVDQAACKPAPSAAARGSSQQGSAPMSATSTWRPRYTAAAHEPLRMSTLARASAVRSCAGSPGAIM